MGSCSCPEAVPRALTLIEGTVVVSVIPYRRSSCSGGRDAIACVSRRVRGMRGSASGQTVCSALRRDTRLSSRSSGRREPFPAAPRSTPSPRNEGNASDDHHQPPKTRRDQRQRRRSSATLKRRLQGSQTHRRFLLHGSRKSLRAAMEAPYSRRYASSRTHCDTEYP